MHKFHFACFTNTSTDTHTHTETGTDRQTGKQRDTQTDRQTAAIALRTSLCECLLGHAKAQDTRQVESSVNWSGRVARLQGEAAE